MWDTGDALVSKVSTLFNILDFIRNHKAYQEIRKYSTDLDKVAFDRNCPTGENGWTYLAKTWNGKL